MSVSERIRVLFCSFVFAFGCLVFDSEASGRWLALTILLYALPLVGQLFNNATIRTYSTWLGIFLVAQALCRPEYFASDYETLVPNSDRLVDSRGLRGISEVHRFTTDEKGFRITKDIDYKDNTTFRIFAVGGSTTKQLHLGDRKTWTHLLQESLQNSANAEIEVINTGVAGLRAINHLATMKQTLSLNPDMYVFLVGANDWMTHLYREHGTLLSRLRRWYSLQNTLLGRAITPVYMRMKYGSVEARRIADNEITQDMQTALSEETSETVDPYLLMRGSVYQHEKRIFMPASVRKDYVAELDEIVELCERHSVGCIFVTQPNGYKKNITSEFKQSFGMTGVRDKYTLTLDSMIYLANLYNSFLIEFAAERNVPLCDLDVVIEPSFDNFYDEMHFNNMGAERVADHLHNCISDITIFDRD